MAFGERDPFGSTEFFGDDRNSVAGMAGSKRGKKHKSRTKKTHSSSNHSSKSNVRRRKSGKNRTHSTRKRSKGSRRKGMSKEFLRNLRRKHGLGEFKKK